MEMAGHTAVDEKVLNRFRSLLEHKRLAHAYLLLGPRGSGKRATAFLIAQTLLCEGKADKPCGRCSACLKVQARNHPDVYLCDQGEEENIKIHQVREIIRRMQLHPYEAKMKVVILDGVDLLTTEAASAFLKTLEEPSADSLLLLTASSRERILDTVVSRCQVVHFFGESGSEVSGRLMEGGGMDQCEAQVMARFAEGYYGKALLLKERNFIAWKNMVLDHFVFGEADEKFFKSVLSDNQQVRAALEVLLFCFKDMLLLKVLKIDGRIANEDRLADLQHCLDRFSFEQLQDLVATVINTKKMLDGNFNMKIPFMVLKEKIWVNHAYRCN